MQLNQMLKAILFAAFLTLAAPAIAHEGHDHGPPAAELPTSSQPRAIAVSENYEIVAILKGEALFIYVDRFSDNSPVTQARLVVTIGATEIQPRLIPQGVFKLENKDLVRPGKHELIFTIKEGRSSDLLITNLEVVEPPPPETQQTPSFQSGLSSRLKSAVSRMTQLARIREALANVSLLQIEVAGGAIFGLALVMLLLRHWKKVPPPCRVRREADKPEIEVATTGVSKLRPKSAGPAAAAALILLLAGLPPNAIAHGDEDHGDSKSPVEGAGDAPRRLPDASVYLPKPSQRLLEVRTLLTEQTRTRPRLSFVGRVIANPDRFGVVQSALGGRVTPPPAGLPKLGQGVTAGEVLGYVSPHIAAIDRSDAGQTAGDLDQQIALAEIRLERAKRLYAVNAGTRVQVEDREIELKGLQKRRAALTANTTKPEPLVAPIDGVIAATKVVVGQVVEPKDVLYEIIDPSSLWVEAFSFHQSAPETFSEATAIVQGLSSFKLSFIGRSRALRQQSTILQFAIEKPPASLNVGMPVTVLVQEGEPVEGIVLPKAAVVRAGNGEQVVWQHTEPERFVAAPVKAASFDGERVLVQKGLKAGERVVVQGAELINQVR